jgi:hypothetical protein
MKPRHIRNLVFVLLLICAFGGCCEWLARQRDAARMASCRPYMVFNYCEWYASDHAGAFPSLSSTPGKLMFSVDPKVDWGGIHLHDYECDSDQKGQSDHHNLVGKPEKIDDWSYVYLGYFLENETQGKAFVEAYKRTVSEKTDFENDLAVADGQGNLGKNRLIRLKAPDTLPAELCALGEKATQIPVVVEWPGNHRKMGGKVTFLDGRTEYMCYPGKFPMTPAFIQGLRELDTLQDSSMTKK